jgi:hypothetical protein
MQAAALRVQAFPMLLEDSLMHMKQYNAPRVSMLHMVRHQSVSQKVAVKSVGVMMRITHADSSSYP